VTPLAGGRDATALSRSGIGCPAVLHIIEIFSSHLYSAVGAVNSGSLPSIKAMKSRRVMSRL
jgi:hypothetical protein